MACLTPFYIDVTDRITGLVSKVLVPCGKCEGCLKKKQSDWISRLYVESLMSLSSFFVTLTYDENHLPFPEGVNVKDVQLFMRRFKKKSPYKFKYFVVSEYGSISSRPHYHILFFFRDRYDWITLSYDLADCWKLGQHKIGTVDIASIRYCAKYCLKSRVDSRHLYKNKTFSLVSKANRWDKMNSIGSDLFSELKKYSDREIFEVVSYDRCVAMPRYYRDKVFDDLAKFNHAEEIQRIYKELPGALDASERYNKRISFERKQRQM